MNERERDEFMERVRQMSQNLFGAGSFAGYQGHPPGQQQRRRSEPRVAFDGVRCGIHKAVFHGATRRETAMMEHFSQRTPFEVCQLPANHDGQCRWIVLRGEWCS